MLHTGLRLYRSNCYYGRTPLSAFALPPVHADVAAAAVLFALALAALPRPRVCSHSEAAPPAPPPQSVHLLRAPALGQPHSGAKCGPFVWF
jgi:hypothetical protein